MRASLASLGPGVLQGWTCETEQFLGLVSAPRRLCTTAANVSRAAWLYVRQELAQASVKPSGQPLPFTAESSACRQRPCCSPLSLKDACPVPCSSLLASLCCSATCCLLRRPLSHSTELGAAGQPPPRPRAVFPGRDTKSFPCDASQIAYCQATCLLCLLRVGHHVRPWVSGSLGPGFG